jgi:conserved oligomeric Golgi complex subunit 8
MADPLYELLTPYLEAQDAGSAHSPSLEDPVTLAYLAHLTSLSLSSLTSAEPQSLSQTSHSNLRSLQSLSKRSYKSIISSADHLNNLEGTLPTLGTATTELYDGLPSVENEASAFAEKYSKASENPVLDRRRNAMLLARNIDRVSDVLELPSLLSSAIASATTSVQTGPSATASVSSNYASALDLHAHIKRLQALYPNSAIVKSIGIQAEDEMKGMTSSLIASLQPQGIKLAAGMRTIGWLRRVAPELDEAWTSSKGAGLGMSEGALGAVFLVCRLSNLLSMLEALDPLKELADQETARRQNQGKASETTKAANEQWAGGQQTERYLKRYIEIFREQSFAMISMHKSIFPSALPMPGAAVDHDHIVAGLQMSHLKGIKSPKAAPDQPKDDLLHPLPSALSTFGSYLVELLLDTLRTYLPNVRDRASRDSLLTQVLYCAGSLGRLGGDFGLMLAFLDEESEDDGSRGSDDDEDEWVEVMKKHKIQASRLELLASGVGAGKVASAGGRDSPSAG